MIYKALLASDKESLSDKVQTIRYIKTKRDLDKVICKEDSLSRIIMSPEFINTYFDTNSINSYVQQATLINNRVKIELPKEYRISKDADKWASKIEEMNHLAEFIPYIKANPEKSLNGLKELVKGYRKNIDASLEHTKSLNEVLDQIEDLTVMLEDSEHALSVEKNNKQVLADRLQSLVSTLNFQYNAGIDVKTMFSVNNHNYDKVLYIKEDTKVRYVDTLVYYIKEIFRVVYGMPTRLLVIEPFYARNTVRMYPDLKPHYSLTEGDVLKADILMLGIQKKLLENILKNPTRVSLLIIHDKSGMNDYAVTGDKVEYLRTASSISDAPAEFPKDRVITYGDANIGIPEIKEFDVMDASERMSLYSSLPLVKKVINLLENK